MPVTIQLDEDLANTLYYELSGKWTWAEYLVTFEQEIALAKDLDRYSVIASLLKGDYIPVGPSFFSMYSTFRRTPATMDMLVIVTASSVVHYMANMMGKIYPEMKSSFQVVRTMEEARNRLRERNQIPHQPHQPLPLL